MLPPQNHSDISACCLNKCIKKIIKSCISWVLTVHIHTVFLFFFEGYWCFWLHFKDGSDWTRHFQIFTDSIIALVTLWCCFICVVACASRYASQCLRWAATFPHVFFLLSSDIPTQVFGDHLRQQVEDRLKFYETGEAPAKNIDIMRQAVTAVCTQKGVRFQVVCIDESCPAGYCSCAICLVTDRVL